MKAEKLQKNVQKQAKIEHYPAKNFTKTTVSSDSLVNFFQVGLEIFDCYFEKENELESTIRQILVIRID